MILSAAYEHDFSAISPLAADHFKCRFGVVALATTPNRHLKGLAASGQIALKSCSYAGVKINQNLVDAVFNSCSLYSSRIDDLQSTERSL